VRIIRTYQKVKTYSVALCVGIHYTRVCYYICTRNNNNNNIVSYRTHCSIIRYKNIYIMCVCVYVCTVISPREAIKANVRVKTCIRTILLYRSTVVVLCCYIRILHRRHTHMHDMIMWKGAPQRLLISLKFYCHRNKLFIWLKIY